MCPYKWRCISSTKFLISCTQIELIFIQYLHHCPIWANHLPSYCFTCVNLSSFDFDLYRYAVDLFDNYRQLYDMAASPGYIPNEIEPSPQPHFRNVRKGPKLKTPEKTFTSKCKQTCKPMLFWCWPIVHDAGPTSNQHWVTISCLLWYQCIGIQCKVYPCQSRHW